MRIGEPARRRGVADIDILHAVRAAIRMEVMDEDPTMLIGPASDGALLEIGVLDLDGDDPVVIHAHATTAEVLPIPRMRRCPLRHTDNDIQLAAQRFEQLADQLDPATAEVEHTDDLRQIVTASDTVRDDEAPGYARSSNSPALTADPGTRSRSPSESRERRLGNDSPTRWAPDWTTAPLNRFRPTQAGIASGSLTVAEARTRDSQPAEPLAAACRDG